MPGEVPGPVPYSSLLHSGGSVHPMLAVSTAFLSRTLRDALAPATGQADVSLGLRLRQVGVLPPTGATAPRHGRRGETGAVPGGYETEVHWESSGHEDVTSGKSLDLFIQEMALYSVTTVKVIGGKI